ncbi:hypothetical protein [Neobacillus drentensis]|uniref:hypothetical protein n=1 Tax=Neobacillus drentensis TaxID=220684 RepID=UPI002FFFC33D
MISWLPNTQVPATNVKNPGPIVWLVKSAYKLLFIETFRQEIEEWKKIREYVENSYNNPLISQEK